MKPHKLEQQQRLPESFRQSSVLTRYRQLIHAAVVALSLSGAVACNGDNTPDKPDGKPDSGQMADGGMSGVDSGTDSGTDSGVDGGNPDASDECADLKFDETEWKASKLIHYGDEGTIEITDPKDLYDGISVQVKSKTLERETDIIVVMAPSTVTLPGEYGDPVTGEPVTNDMELNGLRLMNLDAVHPYKKADTGDCVFNEVGFNQEMMKESANKPVITVRQRIYSMIHRVKEGLYDIAGSRFEVEHKNGDTIAKTPSFSDILFANHKPVGKVSASADADGYITLDISEVTDEGSHIADMLELEIDGHTFTRTSNPDRWISDEVFPNGTQTLKGKVLGGNSIVYGNPDDVLPISEEATVNVELPDTTAPGAPALDQSDMTVGPAVTMVTISGDIPNPSDTATVQMRMDGGSWVDMSTYTAGDNRFMLDVAPGATYEFRAVDSSDNASGAVGLTVSVDTMAPMTPVVNLPATTTVGPNNLAVNVMGTLPQPADTVALEVQIDGGTWTAVTGYTSGDSTYSFNVNGPAMVKLRVKDSFGNTAETSTYTINLDNVAPVDIMVDKAIQILPIAATEFTVNLTVSADTEKVYIYKDGAFYDEVLTGGQTMFAVPVTHAAGTTATYGFAPLDQFENEGNKKDVEVQMAPAPTISNLAIDCSGTSDLCLSGGLTYPVRFTVSDVTECTAIATTQSGTGTPGSTSSVTIVGNTGSFIYTTGQYGFDVIRINLTCMGAGGEESAFIDITLY